MLNDIKQKSGSFSGKGQIANILVFVGHISESLHCCTLPLCCESSYRRYAGKGSGCFALKLCLQKQLNEASRPSFADPWLKEKYCQNECKDRKSQQRNRNYNKNQEKILQLENMMPNIKKFTGLSLITEYRWQWNSKWTWGETNRNDSIWRIGKIKTNRAPTNGTISKSLT